MLRGSNKEVVIKVLKPGVQDVLTTGECRCGGELSMSLTTSSEMPYPACVQALTPSCLTGRLLNRIADLNFLYLATRFLEVAQPQLSRASLSAVVGDIRASMLEEVDFRKEAQHLQVRGPVAEWLTAVASLSGAFSGTFRDTGGAVPLRGAAAPLVGMACGRFSSSVPCFVLASPQWRGWGFWEGSAAPAGAMAAAERFATADFFFLLVSQHQ